VAKPDTIAVFFERAFRIRRDELHAVHLFFALFVAVGMFFTFGSAIGDALFLSHYGPERALRWLPWVYVGIGVAMVAVTAAYDVLQQHLRRELLIPVTYVAIGLSVVVFRELLRLGISVELPLVIWLEGAALLSIALFFSFAGDYFASRDARRLYGYISGGLAVGTVLSGLLIDPLVRLLGDPAELLYVCGGTLAASAVLAVHIRRALPLLEDPGSPGAGGTRGAGAALKHPFVLLIVAVVLLGLVGSITVDFQLKIVAARTLHGAALASFFGALYAAIGAVHLVFQFAVVGWLLRRGGVIWGLTLLPVVLVAGGVAFYAMPGIVVISVLYGLRLVLKDALEMPARELLFLPLPSRVRHRSQALVSGAVVPLGQGLGGVVLLLVAGWLSVRGLAWLVVATSLATIALLVVLRVLYRRTLAGAIARRGLGAADLEHLLERGDPIHVLEQMLATRDAGALCLAVDMSRSHPHPRLAAAVSRLAGHADERVACAAVSALSDMGGARPKAVLLKALEDGRPAVRAAALVSAAEAFARGERPDFSARAADPEPLVADAALVACLRFGDEGERSAAGAALAELVGSRSASERARAARVIGRAQPASSAEDLARLIEDEQLEVACAAARAARGREDLADRLMAAAHRPGLARAVAGALEPMPGTILPRLAAELDRDGCPARVGGLIARAVARIGGAGAASLLWERLAAPGPVELRAAMGAALRLIPGTRSLLPAAGVALEEQVCREAATVAMLLQAAELPVSPATAAAVRDHGALYGRVLLSLCIPWCGGRRTRSIEYRLRGESPRGRSNALELLEELLPRTLREPVLSAMRVFDAPTSAGEPPPPETLSRLHALDAWGAALACRIEKSPGGERTMSADPSLLDVMARISFLKEVALFEDIPANHLTALVPICEEVPVREGEVLFRAGEPGDSLYLVREGAVGVLVGDGEVEVAKLGPGECVGEMALIDDSPRSATAVVREDGSLLRIAADVFSDLLHSEPEIALGLLRTLVSRLRRATARSSRVDMRFES